MTGLNDHDTLLVKLINDNQPIADAGIDFIAPINKKVYLDGSGSKDIDNVLEYKWDVLEDEINLSQLESSKPKPHFLYPKNLNGLPK